MMGSIVVKKIAVLGAGVMGAQIAAHCVNAGFETYLYDLGKEEGPRNALINQAIAKLQKQMPTPLATPMTASLLVAKNYEDDLAYLTGCDLIIEAIAERMDWKEALLEKIAPYLTAKTIIVSNSSGLSLNMLAMALPEVNRERFCGVHFFNPPRYMHLAELIPTQHTSSLLLDGLETWLTSYLGKGVIRAKDTPNFIANRIGVFSLLTTIHHAERLGLGLDEVDALTGTLLGRPKSATFRTMDVVGLDTMQHVVHTMKVALENDPWHALFTLPEWMNTLISQGHLGQKTGSGLYRKQGKSIEVFDPRTNEYRVVTGDVSPEVKDILSIKEPAVRMEKLFTSTNKQAQFMSACFRDLFHYCAFHLQGIADNVRDVDEAMQWGFGWKEGPFTTWQMFGVSRVTQMIEQGIETHATLSQAALPTWLFEVHDFYETYQEKRQLPVYAKQGLASKGRILLENEAVSVINLPNDVACVSFKSKANTIGNAVLDGLQEALTLAESSCQGLVIHQQDPLNFSSGADLRAVGALISSNQMNLLEEMLRSFQQTVMRVKYSAIPVIAALRGRALGGGCELMMQCDAIVAAFESYPGLVEVGVGLIPAGGGCKEWAMRAAASGDSTELTRLMRFYFEQTARAVVTTSATDAKEKGFLKATDHIIMNSNEVLYAAVETIKSMNALNYKPPMSTSFKVCGREGHAQLQAGLINWFEGDFISEHDYFLTNKLAYVLCGGDVNAGALVNEEWILKLEREAFIELAQTPLTAARIAYLLETGKPLRN